MTRPPFPQVIDSSMMHAFKSCPQKCFLEYINHWKTKTPSVHLHAGKAFASGLEAAREAFYLSGKPETEAKEIGLLKLLTEYGDFECPEDSDKSATGMAGAFEYYFEKYPMHSDICVPAPLPGGKKGIEFSFAEPIDVFHPQTGDPLLYVGRMDMLANYAGGLWGEDDKTTSRLGATWSKQWDLRSQFTGYTWGAHKAGLSLNGFIIRGISILKRGFDAQQAITYRPDWQIDRWYEQLCRDIEKMVKCWKDNYWDWNLDESCNAYGGCSFKPVCLSKDPQPWLESGFEKRVWDPVNRTERVIPLLEV